MKKINKQRLNYIDLGELTCPLITAELKRKKDSFFSARTQPMKAMDSLLPEALLSPVFPQSRPSPSLDMWEFACGSSWLQTVNYNSMLIPSKPLLLDKYLAVHMFYVNVIHNLKPFGTWDFNFQIVIVIIWAQQDLLWCFCTHSSSRFPGLLQLCGATWLAVICIQDWGSKNPLFTTAVISLFCNQAWRSWI